MKINLFINDDLNDSHIVNFCMQSKRFKFVFQKLSNIKLVDKQKKLIIIKNNFPKNDFMKKIKKNIFLLSKNTCLFLPKKYNQGNLKINVKAIDYPVKFIDFENHLLNVFKNKKIVYKNLELRNDNALCNNDNNKQVYLTEIESNIMSLLFETGIIDKNALNREVLNQSPLIDSKSLESHLYRLRKKLINVDSNKKIILIKNQKLQII